MSKKFLSPIKLAQGTSVPSTGSSGELFYNTTDAKIYTHNGAAWVASGGGVTNSATAPSNPTNGDAWFNTEEGSLFVYYNDGDSGQWVEASNNINNAEPNQIPAGAMMAWGSSVIPNNWLLCDGSAVSRETYASLFAAIGTTYGAGNGTTTFNLPNLRGRTIAGLDSTQEEFNFLGETGGAKTHTLTVSEMPSHNHGGATANAGSHSHSSSSGTSFVTDTGAGTNVNTAAGGNFAFRLNGASTASAGDHNHTINAQGGGGAHNNLQPYIVLNYIIKFSAGETPGDSQLATRVGALETQNNATPISPNYLVNGGMDISQRGTSFNFASGGGTRFYAADRFFSTDYRWTSGSNVTVANDTSVFPAGVGVYNSYRISTGATGLTFNSGGIQYIRTFVEGFETERLYGKTVTLSFYVRSSLTGTYSLFLGNGNWEAGTTTRAFTPTYTINAVDTWERKTITIDMASAVSSGVWNTSNGIGLEINWMLGGNADRVGDTYGSGWTNFSVYNAIQRSAAVQWATGANRNFYLAGVQLEEGPYATPFRRNAPSIQAELAACQRYYYQSAQAYGYYNIFNSGNMQSTTFKFPVTMRTSSPVVTVYDNAGTINRITIANAGGSAQQGITPPSSMQLTADGFMWVAGGMGGTTGNNGMVYMSRFDVSAEL